MHRNFEELGIEQNLLSAIKELGFEKPMPVQTKVIPALLNEPERNIIALAQTGTGKTAAFGLPIIQMTDRADPHPQYLILSPTRELCLQIADDLADFARFSKEIRIAAVFGGASIETQIKMLKRGAHIISATPGRLLDLIHRGKADLRKIKTVVLDEADEMLNMGFREDLEAILQQVPEIHNTLLFSATMPKEVQAMASRYIKNPIEITIGKRNAGADNIKHICFIVHAKDRYPALKRIVDFYPQIYGIVFCRTRKETQEVADQLLKDGYNADALHGDLSQTQRDTVMNKFRIRHLKLLVATDVAARGLDVDDLTHIINYNLPDELDVYTHRSGRTGRAGKIGSSIVIANLKEKQKLHQIEKQINNTFAHQPVPSGREICEKQLFNLIDRMEKVEVDHTQIDSFLPDVYRKLQWLDQEELIKKFVSLEFNRFLDYYKNSPDLNVPAETPGYEQKDFKKRKRNSSQDFTRFFLNLGRSDELKPATVIGMINDFTGIRDINVGGIDILQNFSFIEVDREYADTVYQAFRKKKLGKRPIALEYADERKEGGAPKFKKGKNRHGSKPF
jgi:ATP-dependent RNA helicase DeaD